MRYLTILFLFAIVSLSAQDCVIDASTAAGTVYVGTSHIKYAVENGGTAVIVRAGRASRVQTTNTVDQLITKCAGSLFKFTDSRSGRTYAISKSYVMSALEHTDGTLVIVSSDPGVSFKTVETAAALDALVTACGANAINTPYYDLIYISQNGDDAAAVPGHPVYPYLTWDAAVAARTAEDFWIDGSFTATAPLGAINVNSTAGSSITAGSAADVFVLDSGSSSTIIVDSLTTVQSNVASNMFDYAGGATDIDLTIKAKVINNVHSTVSTWGRYIFKAFTEFSNLSITAEQVNLNGGGIDAAPINNGVVDIDIGEANWAAIEAGATYSEYIVNIRNRTNTTIDSFVTVKLNVDKFNRPVYEETKRGLISIGQDASTAGYYGSFFDIHVGEWVSYDSIQGSDSGLELNNLRGTLDSSTVRYTIDKARGVFNHVFYGGKTTYTNSLFDFNFGDIRSTYSIIRNRKPSFMTKIFDNSTVDISCDKCVVTEDHVLEIEYVDTGLSTNYKNIVSGYYETESASHSPISATSDFILDGATLVVANTSQPAITASVPITVTIRGCYYTNSLVTDPDVTLVYETDCVTDIAWPENNTYYVTDGGDDATAVKSDRIRTWLSPWAAWDALTPAGGSVIDVAPGHYLFTGPHVAGTTEFTQPLFSDPVTLNFPDATIESRGSSSTLSFFTDSGVGAATTTSGPVDITFNGGEIVEDSSLAAISVPIGYYHPDSKISGHIRSLKNGITTGGTGREWGMQFGAGYVNLSLDTVLHEGEITASFYHSVDEAGLVTSHSGRNMNLKIGYLYANQQSGGGGLFRYQGNGSLDSLSTYVLELGTVEVGPALTPGNLFNIGANLTTQDQLLFDWSVDRLTKSTFGSVVSIGHGLNGGTISNSTYNISLNDVDAIRGNLYSCGIANNNFNTCEINLDIGTAVFDTGGVVEFANQFLVDSKVNIHADLLEGKDPSGIIQLDQSGWTGNYVVISGRYVNNEPASPVLDLTNIGAGGTVILKDLTVINDGTVAAIKSDLPITVIVSGTYDGNTIILDTDITYVYNEYGALVAGADGYIGDDLAAGTAAYSVLTGDFILNFGANIDMQFNDARFFDVTPRANSGGQTFFSRIGSSAFHQDVYQDGAGSGYVEMLSPGGSIVMRDLATGITFGLPASATSNFIIQDSRTVKTGSPMIFDADYSGNYTARSVVDKAYVDGINGIISALPLGDVTILGGLNDLNITATDQVFTATGSAGFTGPGGAVNDITSVSVSSSGANMFYTDDSEALTNIISIGQSAITIGEQTAGGISVDVNGYLKMNQLASVPVTVGDEGEMFFNTTDNCTYVSDGTDWKLHSGTMTASVYHTGGTNTSVSAATPEQINLTTSGTVSTVIAESQYTIQADGDIQYTGNNNAEIKIYANISASTAGAADMYYYIAINGTVVATSRARRDHGNNDYGSITISYVDPDADTNDVYSVFVEPVSGTANITISDVTMTAQRIK